MDESEVLSNMKRSGQPTHCNSNCIFLTEEIIRVQLVYNNKKLLIEPRVI